MSQSDPQPQEARTSNQQVSNVKAALDCPEILHAIGEWILVDEWATTNERNLRWYHPFQPKTTLSCILVSRFWCEVFTPLLWSVSETRRSRYMSPELLTKYSRHVRILDYWPGNFAEEPLVHTQLRRLTIEPGGYIGANTNLMNLGLAQVALFKRGMDLTRTITWTWMTTIPTWMMTIPSVLPTLLVI
jgi:hypothetical protein